MSLSSTIGSGLPPGTDVLEDLIRKGRLSENVEDMRGGNPFNELGSGVVSSDVVRKGLRRFGGAGGGAASLSEALDNTRDLAARMPDYKFPGAVGDVVPPGLRATPTFQGLRDADNALVASAPAATTNPLAADLGYNSINTSAFNSLDPPQPPPQPAPYASWRAYDRRYLDVEDPPDPMKLRFPTYRAAGGLDVARDMIVRRMYGADQ